MKTIRNKKVAALLMAWLDKNHLSIKKAAEKLNVSSTTLWRQLKGLDPIPMDRLQEMIRLWSPSDEEVEKISELLNGEQEQPDASEQEAAAPENPAHEPGDIVYYGSWGSVCKGIFCGLNLDGSQCIVFQIFPKQKVMSPDNGKHEYYVCVEIRPDDLFPTPEELMEHETASIRAHMERQIESMTKKPVNA